MKYSFVPEDGAHYRYDYEEIARDLNEFAAAGNDAMEYGLIRQMCLTDLFFLTYFVLGIRQVAHPWLAARVYEVQDKPWGTLDLWSREHFKSTILTYASVIQTVLQNPEERLVIISHTRAVAKSFLLRLKVTFETNEKLQQAFPDIIWERPDRDAPKWAVDTGLMLRRQGVYNEATIEAWGIIDGMPTGKHFTKRVYDDLVTEATVTSPDAMQKVLYAYQLSHNVGARGGDFRVIGTIYHYADLYMQLQKEKLLHVRKHPCLDKNGHPVYLTEEEVHQKRKHMGQYVFACQMLLDPVAEGNQEFKREWIKFFTNTQQRLNYYIMVDPAGKKGRHSDYTSMFVVGVDSRHNRYVVDIIRDRLTLRERWTKLKGLVAKWNPMAVGYEQYGMQADFEYITEKMDEEGFSFRMVPLGGQMSKESRIRRLIPLFEDGKIHFPHVLTYRDSEGKSQDLVDIFIQQEYLLFPYSPHDDMIDCLARIIEEELGVVYPRDGRITKFFKQRFDPLGSSSSSEGWTTL